MGCKCTIAFVCRFIELETGSADTPERTDRVFTDLVTNRAVSAFVDIYDRKTGLLAEATDCK